MISTLWFFFYTAGGIAPPVEEPVHGSGFFLPFSIKVQDALDLDDFEMVDEVRVAVSVPGDGDLLTPTPGQIALASMASLAPLSIGPRARDRVLLSHASRSKASAGVAVPDGVRTHMVSLQEAVNNEALELLLLGEEDEG